MTNQKQLTTQQLINLLFTQTTKPDGRSFQSNEVAEATGISTSLISALRTGRRANPSLETIRQLLDFFNTPLSYMEAKTKEEAIAMLNQRTETQHAQIRFRGIENQELSPKGRKQVEALLKFVIDYEKALERGLPEPQVPRFDEEGNVLDEN
jgi:transcriptional regulator with XRE-family HTH domain